MRSTYSVLLLSYQPVSVAGGVRKAVGGYLRYMQFRDQRAEAPRQGGLDAFVRYVSHRDRTSPGGRIFGAGGPLTSADRRRLVDYVARSTKGLAPNWVKNRDGLLEDRQRAVYQLVISPDDWRGLDLRRVTRAAMKQLESDAGAGGLGPWFAAEHRNTAHHHVQIALAARREIAPGRFSTLIINRARLQRMKEAIWADIEHQRAHELKRAEPTPAPRIQVPPATLELRHHDTPRWRWVQAPAARARTRSHFLSRLTRHRRIAPTLLRLRAVAQRYHQRMESQLERELIQAEREGWVR
jgi:hypothetical protein